MKQTLASQIAMVDRSSQELSCRCETEPTVDSVFEQEQFKPKQSDVYQ